MNPTVPGAYCAVHRLASATSTCSRCGNFMCWDCSVGGTNTACPSCSAITGNDGRFPFDRDNQEGLIGHTWDVFKRDGVMLTVSGLIAIALSFGGGLVGNVIQMLLGVIVPADSSTTARYIVIGGGSALAFAIQYTVQGVATMGFARIAYNALAGKGVDIAQLFSQVSKVGKYLLLMLLTTGLAGIPVVALIGGVAGLSFGVLHESTSTQMIVFGAGTAVILLAAAIVLMPLYFAQLELALNDDATPWQAMSHAWKIGSGKRMTIFGFGLALVGIVFAGVFLCLVGVLPALAFAQLLFVALYWALRRGSGLPELRVGGAANQPVMATSVTPGA